MVCFIATIAPYMYAKVVTSDMTGVQHFCSQIMRMQVVEREKIFNRSYPLSKSSLHGK